MLFDGHMIMEAPSLTLFPNMTGTSEAPAFSLDELDGRTSCIYWMEVNKGPPTAGQNFMTLYFSFKPSH